MKASLLSDLEIIKQVKSEAKYYRVIIMRYQSKLTRYAQHLVWSQEDAQDIVQDTFIKAYQNLNSYNDSYSFNNWIYRIAHNEAVSYLRKQNKHVSLNPAYPAPSDVNLELEYSKTEAKIMVNKCLRKLPLTFREVLSLFYVEDKSYQEISDIMRMSVGNVGVNLNRAKKYMREICQKIK